MPHSGARIIRHRDARIMPMAARRTQPAHRDAGDPAK